MSAKVTEDQLLSIALFEGLALRDLTALAGMAEKVTVASEELLIEENARAGEVFAIVRGRVEIVVTMPDGRESDSIANLKEGDTLGESILLGKSRRIASAVAKGEVVALKWNGPALVTHLEQNPFAGYVVMRNLARVIHERLTATNMFLRNTLNRVVTIL